MLLCRTLPVLSLVISTLNTVTGWCYALCGRCSCCDNYVALVHNSALTASVTHKLKLLFHFRHAYVYHVYIQSYTSFFLTFMVHSVSHSSHLKSYLHLLAASFIHCWMASSLPLFFLSMLQVRVLVYVSGHSLKYIIVFPNCFCTSGQFIFPDRLF